MKKRKKTRGKKNSVRLKLLLSFLVMIILILCLGTVTYQKASRVIMENYEKSIFNSMTANGDYLQLVLNSVEAKATQLVSNENVKYYYAGNYAKGSIEELNAYDSMYKDLLATIGSDKFM